MPLISVTLAVFHDTVNVVNELQLLNIAVIVVTFAVFQPLVFNVVRELQPENMPAVDVTFDVSSPLRSASVREVQL